MNSSGTFFVYRSTNCHSSRSQFVPYEGGCIFSSSPLSVCLSSSYRLDLGVHLSIKHWANPAVCSRPTFQSRLLLPQAFQWSWSFWDSFFPCYGFASYVLRSLLHLAQTFHEDSTKMSPLLRRYPGPSVPLATPSSVTQLNYSYFCRYCLVDSLFIWLFFLLEFSSSKTTTMSYSFHYPQGLASAQKY